VGPHYVASREMSRQHCWEPRDSGRVEEDHESQKRELGSRASIGGASFMSTGDCPIPLRSVSGAGSECAAR
jgi:hypothetical protein